MPTPPLQRRLSPSALLPRRALLQGKYSAVITDPAASTPSPPGTPAPPNVVPSSGRISTRTRRRTTAAAGSSPPVVQFGFGPVGAPRPSARRYHPAASPTVAIDRTSRFDRGCYRLVGPDGTHPVQMRPRRARGNPFYYGLRYYLTHHPSPRLIWTPSAQLMNFRSVILQRAIRAPTGRGNNRPIPRATPPCAT